MNFKKILYYIIVVIGYVISFWIPLLGIGLWLITRKAYPKIARNYLIAAVIGFCLNYLLSFLYKF